MVISHGIQLITGIIALHFATAGFIQVFKKFYLFLILGFNFRNNENKNYKQLEVILHTFLRQVSAVAGLEHNVM
jgi:hypothetical protein